MGRQELSFTVLKPDSHLPSGIEFSNSIRAAVEAVSSRELYAAIWRPPQVDQIIQSCAAINFTAAAGYKRGSRSIVVIPQQAEPDQAFTPFMPINDLPTRKAILELFSEVGSQLNAVSRKADRFTRELKVSFPGHSDHVHYDVDLAESDVNIQALVCFKGPGNMDDVASRTAKSRNSRAKWWSPLFYRTIS
jgi:hypothetical protein